MHFETWLAFAATSAVLVLIPGPTVLLVASYALGQGWRTALPMAVGVALGDFTAMSVSMLGLGALLASSAAVFLALKWIGAAYLIYLGIKLWRAGASVETRPRQDRVAATRMLAHAWLVTALNPKGITFFVAFVPQFLDPTAAFLPQVVICEATFLVLAFANALFYAGMASRARTALDNRRVVTLFNRVGGSLLIGAAVAAVTVKAS